MGLAPVDVLERPLPWRLGPKRFQLVPRDWMGGKEPHDIDPIEFLAPQISSTAELTYADISRQVEVAYAQDNFVGGCSDNLRFALERNTKFRYSKGLDTSYPGKVLCAPKVATLGATIADKPFKCVQRGNITYLAAGARLLQITDSATRTSDTLFANTITDLRVFGDKLLVATGDANDLQYRVSDVSGGAFTALTGIKAKHLAAVGGQLWRSVSNTSSVWSADAVTGTWTQYLVGNTAYAVTGLLALDGNVLLIFKEDGPYAFDDDLNAVSLAPELELQADAQVGKASSLFNRDAFLTTRLGLMQIIRGGGLAMVGMDRLADPGLPGAPPETRPTALTSDGRFLYALHVPAGVNGIYVWKRDFAGAWHSYLWREDLGASSDLLFATGKLGSTAVNAILFAYASGGNWQLAFARFPSTYDPTLDTAYQFDTDHLGELRTLEGVASYPTIAKYADRLKVIADELTSARIVTVTAYADTELGKSLGEYNESPDDDAAFEPITHKRIALSFFMKSDTVSKSQVLRAFHLSEVLTPPVVRLHRVTFIAGPRTPFDTGGRDMNRGSEVLDQLRELAAGRSSLECVDEDDRKFKAYLSDIQERTLWRRAPQGGAQESMKAVTAVLKEVSLL